jgi:uncharacterized membrane protein (DUF485 family)
MWISEERNLASETLLSTVVQIGVTGAGLVLAIYALIIPLSRKMFSRRARDLHDDIQKFKDKCENLTPQATKQLKQLQDLADSIKETRRFPRYLTIGVLLVFMLYIALALFGSFALFNPINNTPQSDFIIAILFILATVSFMFLGGLTIGDISWTMKKEYEEIKKQIEEE